MVWSTPHRVRTGRVAWAVMAAADGYGVHAISAGVPLNISDRLWLQVAMG